MSSHRRTRRPRTLRIIVTGGGTGGHTYPALTTIRTLRARLAGAGPQPDLLWVGVAHGLEAKIAAKEGVPFTAITTGKLRRSPNLRELGRNVADAFRVPVGVIQAIITVARVRPAVVISTGGYVSVPIGVAAWLLRRPLVMHEQILALGLANRILARLATRILLSHDSSVEHLPRRARSRAVVTGNPIRPDMLAGNREKGIAAYGFDPGQPLVYVTGGAQGALQINNLIAEILPDLLADAQVLHQCGERSYPRMCELAATLPEHLRHRYHVVPFIHDELPDVLAAADVVVARSGAGTVAELTALGKACVFIPLIPSGGDEQRRTARYLADAGAARVLAAADATPQRLGGELHSLLCDPAGRRRMAEAARGHGRPNAAEDVVTHLLDAARR
jgi:UDP-N-acetylglucosamine--N-acetylmuramyl-(pentapeptide) pyrophosphoryl-undecaprenol N-acetylglucosamine transferase